MKSKCCKSEVIRDYRYPNNRTCYMNTCLKCGRDCDVVDNSRPLKPNFLREPQPEAWGDPKPCPNNANVTCHKAVCENCDYIPVWHDCKITLSHPDNVIQFEDLRDEARHGAGDDLQVTELKHTCINERCYACEDNNKIFQEQALKKQAEEIFTELDNDLKSLKSKYCNKLST
jgi:hypothetical protein